MRKRLKIIPIGGLGEIGKNMTLLEYGRNLIIIDCGVMFPENDLYGIDLVLPDFDYVIANKSLLRGIVLTHGHMDHIGGLSYLLKQVDAPVYGTDLTMGMVERQLEEAGLDQVALESVCFDILRTEFNSPANPAKYRPHMLGADDYLSKPIYAENLLSAVKKRIEMNEK